MRRRGAGFPRSIRWTIGGSPLSYWGWLLCGRCSCPSRTGSPTMTSAGSRDHSQETARDGARGGLLTLGAGLFAARALIFTALNLTLLRRTFELTKQGQVTDRYTKAIRRLGSDKPDVRIGGITHWSASPATLPGSLGGDGVLAAFIRGPLHMAAARSSARSGLAPADMSRKRLLPVLRPGTGTVDTAQRTARRHPKRAPGCPNVTSDEIDLSHADLSGAVLLQHQTSPARTSPAPDLH